MARLPRQTFLLARRAASKIRKSSSSWHEASLFRVAQKQKPRALSPRAGIGLPLFRAKSVRRGALRVARHPEHPGRFPDSRLTYGLVAPSHPCPYPGGEQWRRAARLRPRGETRPAVHSGGTVAEFHGLPFPFACGETRMVSDRFFLCGNAGSIAVAFPAAAPDCPAREPV